MQINSASAELSPDMNNLLKTDLNSKLIVYKQRFKAHQKRSYLYKVVYFFLGSCCILLSVILASLSSLDLDSPIARLKFALSIFSGVLSTVLNFIALEKKIHEHHEAKINYITMYKDLKTDLLRNSKADYDDFDRLDTLYVEKEKLILATEPSLYASWCCAEDESLE